MNRILKRGMGLALVCMLSRLSVHGATQYWDTATSAGLQGGNGNWSTNVAYWSDLAGTSLSSWVPGNVAYFASNSVPSTVTVTERFDVGRVTNSGARYTLIITNGGGLLQGTGPSVIGAFASSNTVIIVGGPGGVSVWEPGTGTSTQNVTVGLGAGASNNLLCVDGAGVAGGAVISNAAGILSGVGAGSCWNTVVVTNGGRIYSTSVTVVGGLSSNNTIIVSGGGSLWNGGGGNFQLAGPETGLNNNTLVIDGQGVAGGAVLTNFGIVMMSANYGNKYNAAIGNRLIVTNGGALSCTHLYAGQWAGASNTTAVISGGAITTVVNVSNTVGWGQKAGSGNMRLTIDGGGVDGGATLNTLALKIGFDGSCDNSIIVTNKGRLTEILGSSNEGVGTANGGTNNTLILAQGGTARLNLAGAGGFYIGKGNAWSNSLVVTDPGSTLDLTGTYNIGVGGGSAGAFENSIQVRNYGVVTNAGFSIPYSTAGNGNGLWITTNGQFYANRACLVGTLSAVTGNFVKVVGPGALLNMGGSFLTIGMEASTNNHLTIDRGGTVDNVGRLTNHLNNSISLLGGTLGVTNVFMTNGLSAFVVGDGTQSATLKLLGGSLNFTNGLLVNAGGSLIGRGNVLAGTSGVILTNGAAVSPGVTGPSGSLTNNTLTWYGGATNLLQITNFSQAAGVGWDLLTVSGALSLTNGSPLFVVKLDTMGALAADFVPTSDYLLKFMNYGTLGGYSASLFVVDTSGFLNPFAGTWSVTNANNALYVVYQSGGALLRPFTATSTWNDPNSGNWSVTGNWVPTGQPVNNGTAVLDFSGSAVYSSTNDLGSFALNKLMLSTTGLMTETNTITGNTLVFTNTGARVDYYHGSGRYLLGCPLDFQTEMVFGGDDIGGMVIVPANITAAGGLTKQGAWTLTLSGSNTFAGPLVVDSTQGALRVEASNALGGINDVVVSNGTLMCAVSGTALANRGHNRRGLVTGANSVWTNSGAFNVASGGYSNAVLTVADGGSFYGMGGFIIGSASPQNSLIVTNGGRVSLGGLSYVGSGGSSNLLYITGSNSLVSSAGTFYIGSGNTTGNRVIVDQGGTFSNNSQIIVMNYASGNPGYLIVTNGGRLLGGAITLANVAGPGVYGKVVVTGSNSLMRLNGSANEFTTRLNVSDNTVSVSEGGVISNTYWHIATSTNRNHSNGVIVTNGGSMYCSGMSILAATNSTNIYLQVTGTNSLWNNGAHGLLIANGPSSPSNHIVISNAGVMTNVGTLCLAGAAATGASDNYVLVDGGTLQAARLTCSNDAPNSVTLNGACSVTLGSLVLSNAGQVVQFKGGTLNLTSAYMSNGIAQVVGDGVQGATLNLQPGTSTFVDGLVITNGAVLSGNGLSDAPVTVYGAVSPGTAGVGALTNSGPMTFTANSVATFEVTTNTAPGEGWDYLLVSNGPLALAGALKPVLLGGWVPSAGDSYVIMSNTVSLTGRFMNDLCGYVPVTATNSPAVVGFFRLVIGDSFVMLDKFGSGPVGAIFTIR